MPLMRSLVLLVLGSPQPPSLPDPNFQEALLWAGQCRWQKARVSALRAMQANPSDIRNVRLFCLLSFQTGQTREVLPLIDRMKQNEPSAMSFAYTAKAYGTLGDAAKVKEVVEPLLEFQEQWRDERKDILRLIDVGCARELDVKWTVDPTKVKYQEHLKGDIRVPLPWTDKPYQKLTWSVEGAKAHRVENLEKDNPCLRVTPDGTKPFALKGKLQLIPYSYDAVARASTSRTIPEDVKPYLLPAGGCNSDDPEIKAIADKLRKDTPYETAKAVLKWCNLNLHFIPPGEKGGGGGKATESIKRGYAHCEGLATVAVGMLRACGIPARIIRGHGAFWGDKGNGSHHCATEFYMPGVGWVLWDYTYEPFVVLPVFVSLWHYKAPVDCKPHQGSPTLDLWNFQSLGLECEFVDFRVAKRWVP